MQKSFSLMKSIGFLLLIIIFIFVGLLVLNNYTVYRASAENIYDNAEAALSFYQRMLDKQFDQEEALLFSMVTTNPNVITMNHTDFNTSEWFIALYHLQEILNEFSQSYPADCFFCYFPVHDQLVTSYYTEISSKREALRQMITQDRITLGDWQLARLDGEPHFVRLVYYNGVYAGIFVSIQTLMEYLAVWEDASLKLYFYLGEDRFLDGEGKELAIALPEDKYEPVQIDGGSCLAAVRPLENAECALASTTPVKGFFHFSLNSWYTTLVFLAGLMSIFAVTMIYFKRLILKPVNAMTEAINELRQGKFEIRVDDTGSITDFNHMADAFNSMTAEIQSLKIDVYEKELERQNLNTQYLKQQIAPHFMINCLNLTYQLVDTDNLELAREVLNHLSQHLRYILSSGDVTLLDREAAMVKNYMELSKIRYPNTLEFALDMDERLGRGIVVPLILLTFVENIIKYEIVMGKKLQVRVEAYLLERPEKEQGSLGKTQRLCLCIWDDGPGFSAENLEKLSDMDAYLSQESAHIGISNTVKRVRNLYPDAAFSFENREYGGSKVTIEIPFVI